MMITTHKIADAERAMKPNALKEVESAVNINSYSAKTHTTNTSGMQRKASDFMIRSRISRLSHRRSASGWS